jgi:hypothetical protein
VSRLAFVTAAALACAAPAHADPSNEALVGVGLGLALPTYGIGVTVHESSHALAALVTGAHVDELHLFPPGEDPHVHVFRFGWTYVHGLTSKPQKIVFYLAPKLTDAILLGGFAALAFTSAWPSAPGEHRYGALALTVLATGFWVDFTKDVFLFSKQNDVVKAFDLWCIHGWRQIPARLTYAAISAGLGVIVARGYERTFERGGTGATPRIAPIYAFGF